MKKLFTLIELIVVIVVIGILSAIVIPNVSSMKESANETALNSTQKNLQTAVDTFMLKNNGVSPTKGTPVLGEPKTLEIYGLHPDQIRNLPKDSSIHWWLDHNFTVWGSYADTPKNVALSSDGTSISWEENSEAKSYNIYEVEKAETQSAGKGRHLRLVKPFSPPKNEAPVATVQKADNKTYLVSAIDRYGFETVPVKVNHQTEEYIEPDKDFTAEQAAEQEPEPEPIKSKRLLDEVPTGWIGVYTAQELAAMTSNKKYILMEDIDLNVSPYNTGEGWNGLYVFGFHFDGNGLSIKNLFINKPSYREVGFFRNLSSSRVKNLNLVNVNVTGSSRVGGLSGHIHSDVILEKVSVTGTINGSVTVGGIVGEMMATNATNQINQSYANVTINASWRTAGAIFGLSTRSSSVNYVNDVYASGQVNAAERSGGLFGEIVGQFTVKNAYSLVYVKGNTPNPYTKNNFPINGSNGFLGDTVYWDYVVSETPNPEQGNQWQRRTTEEMQKQSNYVNWNFNTIWKINEGSGYPELQWQQ